MNAPRACPEWDDEFAQLDKTGTASAAYLVHFEWCEECQGAFSIKVESAPEAVPDPVEDAPTERIILLLPSDILHPDFEDAPTERIILLLPSDARRWAAPNLLFDDERTLEYAKRPEPPVALVVPNLRPSGWIAFAVALAVAAIAAAGLYAALNLETFAR